jgi:hypothetical protein
MNALVIISEEIYSRTNEGKPAPDANDEWKLIVLRAAKGRHAIENIWNECLSEIAKRVGTVPEFSKIYVVFHVSEVLPQILWPRTTEDQYESLQEHFRKFTDARVCVCGFHTGQHSAIWTSVESIDRLAEIGLSAFAMGVVNAAENLGPRRKTEFISILKHRIAYLFIPMDLDLQGISEARNDERGNEHTGSKPNRAEDSSAYLKDVLDSHRILTRNGENTHYLGKLADLQYYVGKVPNKLCSIDDTHLPAGKSMLDLLQSVPLEAASELKGEGETLLALVGIGLGTAAPVAEDKSLIARFMQLLDRSDGENVDEILDFFQAEHKLASRKEERPEGVDSFHDWFCALMNALDTIQQKYQVRKNVA